MEKLETEKKRNSFIIWYLPNTKYNGKLKYELKKFTRTTLRTEKKLRNVMKIGKKNVRDGKGKLESQDFGI